MRVAVLGSGHGGTATAADLAIKGHEVTLAKTSKSLHNAHFDEVAAAKEITLIEAGQTKVAKLHAVTDNIEQAVQDKELIIVFIQSNYHEDLIKRLEPNLKAGQVLLFEPGYLASALVEKHVPNRGLIVAEATSSPLDCRIVKPATVQVSFRNVANHVAVHQQDRDFDAKELLDQLDYNWIYLESVIAAGLHNPNLIVHTVGGLMSVPRIEATGGKYWMYKEVFTPTVWNLVEKLDAEKQAILAAYGLEPLSYVEAAKQRNDPDDPRPAIEIFFDYAENSSVEGPHEVNSRYITEDVPQGLVMMESLGTFSQVATPVCTTLINLANALFDTDFRQNPRVSSEVDIAPLLQR